MADKLNPRQRKFIDGLEEGNSLFKAYVDAGYKNNEHAYAAASQLARNAKIIAELDSRLFARKTAARQRLGSLVDGATNVYIRILKLKTESNAQLLSLQQKTASDIFDRIGLKPKEEHDFAGSLKFVIDYGDENDGDESQS